MTTCGVRSRNPVIGLVAAGIMACAGSIPAAEPPAKTRAALLAEAALPPAVEPPRPASAIVLPDATDGPISVRLSQDPSGPIFVRRASAGDGRLYLGIRTAGPGLSGTADVSRGGHDVRREVHGGELWLSLKPSVGRVAIRVTSPGAEDPVELLAPTTLVEVRGRQIFLNGEPFLIKGVMSRDITAPDAAYARSLGVNTLRGFDALADCERYGFMSITSLSLGPSAAKEVFAAASDADFDAAIGKSVEWLKVNAAPAVASPNALILQLGNEKTGAGGKPPGAEPLTRARRRVSRMLAAARDAVKPLAPMLPIGYANQDLGFLVPDRMDVYMHNSFLHKDRYRYPWEDFLRWQGCLPPDGPSGQGRPFVNSEFGANRYLCQAHHAGPNNPVLEKIHAWNLPCRWAEFMRHGTAGGVIYCLYDLETPRDQGCSAFGILTYDGKPKLACWDVARMWRDFDADVRGNQLVLSYRRDYWARGCQLTLTPPGGGTPVRLPLEDFPPRSTRTIPLGDLPPGDAAEFRWQLDYTTHSGLPNQAAGAWPARLEQQDFLDRLRSRDTYPFLRELFDAQVVTTAGQPAPPTLAEMARPDGITPVVLRKPNGVAYLLLIARESPNEHGPLRDGVSVDVAFPGKVERVDDMTGQPLPLAVDATTIPGGLRLTNLQAARIPELIRDRSDTPFQLPVYRITP